VPLPSEDFHQLPEVFGHEWEQEGVAFHLPFIVDHEEMNELAKFNLVLIACANPQQLFLDHTHCAHPAENIQIQLHDG
jgi:hypothetical protein